jgi:hypothetical protein
MPAAGAVFDGTGESCPDGIVTGRTSVRDSTCAGDGEFGAEWAPPRTPDRGPRVREVGPSTESGDDEEPPSALPLDPPEPRVSA